MNANSRNLAKLLLLLLSIPLTGGYSARAEGTSATAALAESAGAQPAPAPAPAVPDKDRAPVPIAAPPTSSEMVGFWERLGSSASNSLCKGADLKLNQEARLPPNAIGISAGVSAGIKRYLRPYPENTRLALIDQVNIKLDGAIGREVLNIPNQAATISIGVSVSGSLEGQATVVRPLESNKYCKELPHLIKLYEMKTVVPATAKRFAAMDIGEVWKLPLIMRYGFYGGVTATAPQFLTVSFSGGWAKEVKPSVSLFRMSEDKLRLRVRLDRVTVKSYGVSAGTFELPAGDLTVWNSENAIAGKVNDRWAKEINKYIAFKLSYGHASSSGKQLLVEMILDPRNEDQMNRLEQFLSGDLGILKRFVELGVRLNDFNEDDSPDRGFDGVMSAASQVGSSLGAESSYAGSNVYRGTSDNFRIQIPVIHTRDIGSASTYNRYQTLDKKGEVLHVTQESRATNGDTFNIPFIGTLFKYNSQKNVYIINKETPDGSVTRPGLLYQQYEGFVRESDDGARWMIDKANGVLRYVGTNGNGTDESNVLVSSTIFPAPQVDPDAKPGDPKPSKFYNTALMSFKVLVNERGIQGVIFAPAQAILNAFLNVMRATESAIIDKVKDLFKITDKGEVTYDYHKARERLDPLMPSSPDAGTNPLDIVRTLARTAGHVIADIAGIKNASTWKEQSERLASTVAGGGKSGLAYEDFMKVIVQLIEPGNISAELYIHTDKRVKGEPDVTQNYQFFNTRDNRFDPTLQQVNEVRMRFSQPAELTD